MGVDTRLSLGVCDAKATSCTLASGKREDFEKSILIG
jgi:hypothetical protein